MKLYAISVASPEEHVQIQNTFEVGSFEFLTDHDYEFGDRFGFIDFNEGTIERGYVGVNPASQNMIVEVDYEVGDNINTVLRHMDEL
ncbi:hypothetical protein BKP35_11645 [Anaerobacillus arseniciselenatis]|uniref:Uncharacterized protein n=1 Tax=Anaerobacillus arseniciselenatis TaxID=85682 RepID=A0A1S2LH91_9BACI|nr:hypothetical protein BKP35_11645 [Anaerobacillus arseniciselenatis]